MSGGACSEVPSAMQDPPTYKCICVAGYMGDNCFMDIDECTENDPCRNGAACAESNTVPAIRLLEHQCTCLKGFTGDDCAGIVDPCGSTDNCDTSNAKCVFAGPGEFSCECNEDYELGDDQKTCEKIFPWFIVIGLLFILLFLVLCCGFYYVQVRTSSANVHIVPCLSVAAWHSIVACYACHYK
jgi:hypothetical protein